MKLQVLCSDPTHPVWSRLVVWVNDLSPAHDARLVSSSRDLVGGDALFLVSCSEKIPKKLLSRFGAAYVLHASDLPDGRGWSPHIWSVLEGKNELCVSLISAAEEIDGGAIWSQIRVPLKGGELFDEINERLFDAELKLMSRVVDGQLPDRPTPQANRPGSRYRKRTPEDSRIDPGLSIADQFDLLRVSDPHRYPAFIDYRGSRYVITLTRYKERRSCR